MKFNMRTVKIKNFISRVQAQRSNNTSKAWHSSARRDKALVLHELCRFVYTCFSFKVETHKKLLQ